MQQTTLELTTYTLDQYSITDQIVKPLNPLRENSSSCIPLAEAEDVTLDIPPSFAPTPHQVEAQKDQATHTLLR
jgi:hypothetical protein